MHNPYLYLFLTLSALAAIVSISMWIDYFRRIDVFEPEKILHLIIALAIGCITPFISLGIYYFIGKTGFEMNGELFNDLLYTFFAIGMNEELSKIIGVVIVFKLLRKKLNEPIDYLIYAGVVALGFSVIENFRYFNHYGIDIISTRAFYSAVVHIICTSIIVYGYYRHQLFNKGAFITNLISAFILSAGSHALFDLFLSNSFNGIDLSEFSTLVYLFGINFWVQMLNNATNFSSHFDYDKIHYSKSIFYRLLYWYLTTLAITVLYDLVMTTPVKTIAHLFYSLRTDGLLLLIVIARASRFKIVKQKYFQVTLQLPFYITRNNDEDFRIMGMIPIKIRGENAFEYLPTRFLHKTIQILPVNPKRSYIQTPRNVYMTDKVLLHDDVIVYLIKIEAIDQLFFLKPKTRGVTTINDKYIIAGLYSCTNPQHTFEDYSAINYKELKLHEWIYIK